MKLLTRLLTRHYGQKAILLIDEYDVPLDKAHLNGYYDEMIDIIRSMFGQTLKTNNNGTFLSEPNYFTERPKTALLNWPRQLP